MARYMELDPFALAGGMNGKFAPDWYGYANQNPLRWTDPTGRVGVAGVVIGAFVGGIAGYAATGDWKGVVIGAAAGGAVGFFAPWLAAHAANLAGNELLGYAAATVTDIGVNSFGGGLASGLSTYVKEGKVDWHDIGQGALIGGLVPMFTGEALVAGLGEAALGESSALAWEIAGGINGGALGIAGSVLDPKSPYSVRPEKWWKDSGPPLADWLDAAGCKP